MGSFRVCNRNRDKGNGLDSFRTRGNGNVRSGSEEAHHQRPVPAAGRSVLLSPRGAGSSSRSWKNLLCVVGTRGSEAGFVWAAGPMLYYDRRGRRTRIQNCAHCHGLLPFYKSIISHVARIFKRNSTRVFPDKRKKGAPLFVCDQLYYIVFATSDRLGRMIFCCQNQFSYHSGKRFKMRPVF